MHEFLYHFDSCDLVDILCMTEAMFSRHLESVDARDDIVALWLINKHIRGVLMSKLENEFKGLSLFTSPDFVRHGLNLLLG